MKTFLAAVLFCGLSVPAFAQEGLYTVDGTNIDGRKYAGLIEIVEADGIFVLKWELQAGDTAEGYAFLDGDTLTYICQARSADRQSVGLAYGSFKLMNGKWHGKWSSPGVPAPGAEVLTPSKKTIEQLRKELARKPGVQA